MFSKSLWGFFPSCNRKNSFLSLLKLPYIGDTITWLCSNHFCLCFLCWHIPSFRNWIMFPCIIGGLEVGYVTFLTNKANRSLLRLLQKYFFIKKKVYEKQKPISTSPLLLFWTLLGKNVQVCGTGWDVLESCRNCICNWYVRSNPIIIHLRDSCQVRLLRSALFNSLLS